MCICSILSHAQVHISTTTVKIQNISITARIPHVGLYNLERETFWRVYCSFFYCAFGCAGESDQLPLMLSHETLPCSSIEILCGHPSNQPNRGTFSSQTPLALSTLFSWTSFQVPQLGWPFPSREGDARKGLTPCFPLLPPNENISQP